MPNYKFVDTDQLDADLTTVADSIRTKGETSAKLDFPNGFAAAVEAISTGVEVQVKTGSFTTNTSGNATVECGFQPDLVAFDTGDSYFNQPMWAAFAFECSKEKTLEIAHAPSGDYLYGISTCTQTSGGFSINIKHLDIEFNTSNARVTYNYTAIKYT